MALKLFIRDVENPYKYYLYKKNWEQELNLDKLDTWTVQKTHEMISFDSEWEFVSYRFEILRAWMELNEAYNDEYIKGIDYLIDVLDLNKFLNAKEQNYIDHYKDIVFSKKRNIKNLIVDFKTNDHEEVWYRYDLKKLLEKLNHKYKPLLKGDEVYLTNQRLVFSNRTSYTSIYYDEIETVKLNSLFIYIKTRTNEFCLISSSNFTIYTSFERTMKLIKKFL